MFSILTKLSAAFAALAEAVTGLSVTLREADARLRERLLLDGGASPGPDRLPAPGDDGGAEPEAVAPSKRRR